MPTPSPARKREPRWRTMISPPVTVSPANVLTPRRWAFESRPLRGEPSPFLCAMSLALHFRDLKTGELLPVAGSPLVAALGLELEDAQLLATLVGQDLGGHGHALQALRGEPRVRGGKQQRPERAGRPPPLGPPLDERGLPLLDAVLLAAG